MTTRIEDANSAQAQREGAAGMLQRARSLIARAPLFMVMVIAPVTLAAIYNLLIASPVYVSEARFIVRAPNEPQPGALSTVLQGAGLAQGATDSYVVHDYMTSRDAVASLDHHGALRTVFSRPGADFLQRFPRPFERDTDEHLYRAYKRFVSVGYDATTGVSTLRVRAFTAAEARGIASALLDGGERVTNQLNDQAEVDTLERARREVISARLRVSEIQKALTSFRSRERVVDPMRSSSASLDLVTRLSGELATLRAERAGLAAAAAQSPQLPLLDDRIRAYEQEIERERARAAGESNSLAPKISHYERLVLERDFAGESLTAAMRSLELARVDAARKRLYLQRVVQPSLADTPMEPRRWRSFLLVVISTLLAYGAVMLVRAGLREYRQ